MSREIKFRGKRCRDGKWVYGSYLEANREWDSKGGHKSWIVQSAFSKGGWLSLMGRVAVKDDTIGQFTGIKDNNGKEIYEGDIIRFKYEDYSEYLYNGYHCPVEVISKVSFEYGSYYIDSYPCRLGGCLDWSEDD